MGARKPCRPSPRVSSSPPSSTSCPVRFSVAEEAARAQQSLVLRSSSKRPEALTSMIDCVAPLADRPPVDRSCAHNVISTRGTRMGRARSPFRGGTPEFPKKQESKRFFFFFFEGWPGQGQHDDDDRCDCGVSTLTHPSASLRCRPAGARMTNSQTKKELMYTQTRASFTLHRGVPRGHPRTRIDGGGAMSSSSRHLSRARGSYGQPSDLPVSAGETTTTTTQKPLSPSILTLQDALITLEEADHVAVRGPQCGNLRSDGGSALARLAIDRSGWECM